MRELQGDVVRVSIGGRHRLGFVFVQGEFTRRAARHEEGFNGSIVEGEAPGKHRRQRFGLYVQAVGAEPDVDPAGIPEMCVTGLMKR